MNLKPVSDAGHELSEFERTQVEHFAQADQAKFSWQTGNAYMARTERELLSRVPIRSGDRLLEVGCGEGGNLALLQTRPKHAVGVDLSRAKVGWGARCVGYARFLCADATRLPFPQETFDVVFCRDVLHHVANKDAVVQEILRVCRPQGRVVIMEPNGASPIMFLLGLLIPVERDILRNSLPRLRLLLDPQQVEDAEFIRAQPFPVGRVFFHYRWGLPALSGWLAGAVIFGERFIGRLIPLQGWAYLVMRGVKRRAASSRRPCLEP